MDDILSQNQIDDILNNLNQGKLKVEDIKQKKEKVKTYDFRRPNKFSSDQIKVLNSIYDEFTNLFYMHMSTLLRDTCSAKVICVDEQVFREYTNAISSKSIFSIVRFAPLKGSILIEFSDSIANTIINLMLGGEGKNNVNKNTFTEVDFNIMSNFISYMLELLKEAWSRIIELNLSIEHVGNNTQHIHIVGVNDIISIISIKVNIAGNEGLINICTPFLVLEPIIGLINTKNLFSTYTSAQKDEEKDNSSIMQRILNDIGVDTVCKLGESYLSLSEIKKLQEGDVIKLINNINDPVEILIKDQVKFIGLPGIKDNNYSVKIIAKKDMEGLTDVGKNNSGTNGPDDNEESGREVE